MGPPCVNILTADLANKLNGFWMYHLYRIAVVNKSGIYGYMGHGPLEYLRNSLSIRQNNFMPETALLC